MARTADFTTAEFQESRTDEQLAVVIAGGRGFMPAFQEQVNPRGIAALVRHIRRLGGAEVAPEGVAPPAMPPGHPPTGEPQMPPGHPPTGEPQMPPGHPPVELPPGHP
jgi:hypothetical protein